MSSDPLSRDAIGAVDRDGRLGEILDLPEHLRDAIWRVESANIAPQATPAGLAVVGVDGLQRGGELARDALAPSLSAPISVWSEPPLPVGADHSVLLVSYGGDETPVLEAFGALADARRVVLSTGGELAGAAREAHVPVVPLPGGFPEPRLAIGYSIVATLELARLAGLCGPTAALIEHAAATVARLVSAWGPDAPPDSPAKQRARAAQAGETPDLTAPGLEEAQTALERIVAQLLFDRLVELYREVLSARA